MRIIAGSARRTQLTAPRGLAVRPSSDRLRQALFDVLAPEIEGAEFWDLCAGTGAVGLEALSRGASSCLFTEPARPALAALSENIGRCRFSGASTTVWPTHWLAAARRLVREERSFNILYYDPPYREADYAGVLRVVAAGHLVAAGGLAILEHPRKAELPGEVLSFTRERTLGGGSAQTTLFRLVSLPPVG